MLKVSDVIISGSETPLFTDFIKAWTSNITSMSNRECYQSSNFNGGVVNTLGILKTGTVLV